MQTAVLIDPAIACALFKREPTLTDAGLHSMWVCSQEWVKSRVSPYHYRCDRWPSALETAVYFKVLSILARDNSALKQSLLFSVHELLQPYKD